jgi:hypothetical protein
VAGVVSGALVYVASSLLTIAGVLFNWVFYETVLQFGQLINCGVSSSGCSTGIITSINVAWTAFRDISNIVIIGMFTFIAIMTILGSSSYGAKKMISRVLIVAVLINFSLLFTKIIIDVSNFTASQFYTAASANDPDLQDNSPTATATGQTGTGQNGTTAAPGIAGAFMKYAGVSSFGDTASAVFTIGANPQGGAWWGLLYGVVTALLFFVAAIVLFYGSFLLISRAILMVFLMIVSSIAFATYLIPSFSDGSYGYSAWWKILLKNAVFAPLLVVLLWVTLKIGSGFANSSGTLGSVVKNPANPLDVSALFGYIIVIGLLFASFRIASSFSTQIGGFNFAEASLSAPLAALNRFGVSPLLQNWRGRRNLEKSEKEGSNAKVDRAYAEATGNFRPLINTLRRQEKYANRAKSSYDVLNTRAGKVVGGALGVPKVLMTENKSNFADSSGATAKAAADKAAKLATLTDDEKKKIRDEAYDSKMQNKDRDKEMLKRQDEAERKQLDVMKKSADQQASVFEQQKQTMQKELETAEKTKTDLETKHESILKSIAEEMGKHEPGSDTHNDLGKRYDAAKSTRDAEMAQQDDKIKTVRETIQAPVADLQKKIDEIHAPVKALETESKITQQKLKTFDEDRTKEATEFAENAVKQATVNTHETAQNLSAVLAQPRWQQTLGIKPGKDNVTVNQARDAFKKKTANKRMEELARALAEQTKEDGGDKK